jgi:D-3-phosphoglycerate dehydrogenase/C-terminal binding protein
MLSLRRGIATYAPALMMDAEAGWNYAAAPLVARLKGATFGVVGLGRIGLAAARRAAAFDMRVVFYDPYLLNGVDLATGYERVDSLAALAAQRRLIRPAHRRNPRHDQPACFTRPSPGSSGQPARGPIVGLDGLTDALRLASSPARPRRPQKEPADPDIAHPRLADRQAWLDGRLVLTPRRLLQLTSLVDLRRNRWRWW